MEKRALPGRMSWEEMVRQVLCSHSHSTKNGGHMPGSTKMSEGPTYIPPVF